MSLFTFQFLLLTIQLKLGENDKPSTLRSASWRTQSSAFKSKAVTSFYSGPNFQPSTYNFQLKSSHIFLIRNKQSAH